ncbi:MAG: hypothetical protein KDB61_06110 [Planctomycetes bacterium]|nr:hypothetical protein [Planctomycetota bacterium]
MSVAFCLIPIFVAVEPPVDLQSSIAPLVIAAAEAEAEPEAEAVTVTVEPILPELAELREMVGSLESQVHNLEAKLAEPVESCGSCEEDADENPLSWEVSATSVLQTLSGTDQDTAFATGSFDIVLEAALWDGAVGVVDLESVGGEGPDSVIGTMAGWNGDAGSGQSADGVDRLGVLEAFIATPLTSDACVLTFGKVDLGGFFDANALANDETAQFLSGAFVNSAAFEAPDPGPSVVLSYLPANSYDFNLAVSSADNSGEEVFDDVFATAQLGIYTDALGLDGEYRVYGWVDGSRDDLSGLGVSFSQGLCSNFQFFGRCAWQGM